MTVAYVLFVETCCHPDKSEPVAVFTTIEAANCAKGMERRRRSYIKEFPLDPKMGTDARGAFVIYGPPLKHWNTP